MADSVYRVTEVIGVSTEGWSMSTTPAPASAVARMSCSSLGAIRGTRSAGLPARRTSETVL